MEVVSKKYNLKDKEYVFRPNMRGMIEFERMTGKAVNMLSSTEDQMAFIYACTKAGMKHDGRIFSISFEEFIDEIDDGLETLMHLFGKEVDTDEDEEGEKKY